MHLQRRAGPIALVLLLLVAATAPGSAAQAPARQPAGAAARDERPPNQPEGGFLSDLAQALAEREPARPVSQVSALLEAVVRLPVATALGAVLAFRPRRRGTPPRRAAVIQTQIVLAIVGCLVMLVVGASLARAFGIVGAAGLIRYRAKIEDPKDAAVMLSTLGVGLAAGVGVYLLAAFATAFVLGVLMLIESLDEGYRVFDLKVSAGDAARLRPAVERLLARQGIDFDFRASAEGEICYEVRMPFNRRTDRVSNAIVRLDPGGEPAVAWEEKKR